MGVGRGVGLLFAAHMALVAEGLGSVLMRPGLYFGTTTPGEAPAVVRCKLVFSSSRAQQPLSNATVPWVYLAACTFTFFGLLRRRLV